MIDNDNEDADNLLHRLWTKAVGTLDYNKEEWKALERHLWDLKAAIEYRNELAMERNR